MKNTPAQTAEKLGCSVWTVYRLMNSRQISYTKLSRKSLRIDDREIERFTEKKTIKAL